MGAQGERLLLLVRVSWLQFNGPDTVQVYQAFRNREFICALLSLVYKCKCDYCGFVQVCCR